MDMGADVYRQGYGHEYIRSAHLIMFACVWVEVGKERGKELPGIVRVARCYLAQSRKSINGQQSVSSPSAAVSQQSGNRSPVSPQSGTGRSTVSRQSANSHSTGSQQCSATVEGKTSTVEQSWEAVRQRGVVGKIVISLSALWKMNCMHRVGA